MLKPVKTPAQHKAALKRIDRLMGAHAGTPAADELRLLAILVEQYERKMFSDGAAGARHELGARLKTTSP